jgi:hypothetical protein
VRRIGGSPQRRWRSDALCSTRSRSSASISVRAALGPALACTGGSFGISLDIAGPDELAEGDGVNGAEAAGADAATAGDAPDCGRLNGNCRGPADPAAGVAVDTGPEPWGFGKGALACPRTGVISSTGARSSTTVKASLNARARPSGSTLIDATHLPLVRLASAMNTPSSEMYPKVAGWPPSSSLAAAGGAISRRSAITCPAFSVCLVTGCDELPI